MNFKDITFDRKSINTDKAKLLGEGHYSSAWLVDYSIASDDASVPVALKVLNPAVKPKPGSDPNKSFIDEIKFLQKLRHPGVVRILGHGKCKINNKDTFYYIAEYEDAEDLDKFCKSNIDIFQNDFRAIFSLASNLLNTLVYCHSHRILHLDIKPDNILIRYNQDNNTVDCILIDFGKAKNIYIASQDDAGGKYTSVSPVVSKYVHPELIPFLRKNKVQKDMYSDGAQKFDLYSVAVVLKELLIDEMDAKKNLLADEYNFLMLLIANLENTDSKKSFSAIDGLSVLKRHSSGRDIAQSITIRLTGMSSLAVRKKFLPLIKSPEFQRLRYIYQLGLSHLVYPSATHTRFSHSLGTYSLAVQYANHLSSNYFFRFRYSKEEITLLQIYALIHDIGHYPFAHYLEELVVSDDLSINLHHEYYTKLITTGQLLSYSTRSAGVVNKRAKRHGPIVSNILKDITGLTGDKILKIYKEDTLLTSIIDGPIDCDKLDYLIRDGLAAGVPYASSIDIERFLSSLTCTRTNSPEPVIGITSKGVAAVETILMARYQLFSEVYWHKTCRAIAVMIKHAMWMVLQKEDLITQDQFNYAVMHYGDYDFLNWLTKKLSFNRLASHKLIKNALIGNKRNLYKRIITYSSIWVGRAASRSAFNFLTKKCYNYSKACEVKNNIVKILNENGKSKKGWKDIAEHDLLLDMPPANKDIQDGIEVSYLEDSLEKGDYGFEEVSSILQTMSTHYLQRTKKIRLYVHPSLREQIYNLDDYKTIIDNAIINSF